MNALELERALTDIKADILRVGGLLKSVTRQVLFHQDAFQATTARLLHYRNLLRYIRHDADIVSLREYRQTRLIFAAALENHQATSFELHSFQNRHKTLVDAISILESEKTRLQNAITFHAQITFLHPLKVGTPDRFD